MNVCAIIPCYNHVNTIGEIIKKLPKDLPVIIVDDGSDKKITADCAALIRFERNLGKAEAIKAGFKKAISMGFTHALTLDADGQHDPEFAPKFIQYAQDNPNALILGVRDFSHPMIPPKRRFMNNFSNFWFRFETKTELKDTQCGYRIYPLEFTSRLKLSCARYAYEAEILVKTVWAGGKIIPIEIPTIYTRESIENSHYKPFKDTVQISLMNARLSFAAVFFPKTMLKKISIRKAHA